MTDEERECLKKLADFIGGYAVADPQEDYDRAHNFGIGVAATQLLDEEDNQEALRAIRAYASHVTASLKERAEQTDVQLAGCSVAAFGGTSDAQIAKKGMYGWSASYQDVLDLRLKFEKAESLVASLSKEREELKKMIVILAAEGDAQLTETGKVVGIKSEGFHHNDPERIWEIARKALKGEKGINRNG